MDSWNDWNEALEPDAATTSQSEGGGSSRGSRVPALLACLVIAVACQQVLQVPVQTNDTLAASRPTDASQLSALYELTARELSLPVRGVDREDLRDTFDDPRSGSRRHEAIDIMAPRGRAVLAVESGTVARLQKSRLGGTTLYLSEPTGLFVYYYAHLDRYAKNLVEGARVRKGEVIGYVGTTGNAPEGAPHLHFAIHRVPSPNQWWGGEPVNPFLVLRER